MVEIFKYTERVVNMVRPRRLLFMAIGKFLIDFRGHTSLISPRRRGSSGEDESATLSSFPLCARSEGERGCSQRVHCDVGRYVPDAKVSVEEYSVLGRYARHTRSVSKSISMQCGTYLTQIDALAVSVDDRDAEERDENDTADVGGDCGGKGMHAGSTLASAFREPP